MLPDATVRYADHDDAVIDLHLPEKPSGRLVVLVHGGFWKQAWDRRHTRRMARALADAGCVVATPEYRRVGGGGGWPTTCDDVRDAVARLPELLAGLDVPVGPLTVTGHSAGGHLALWLATTGLRIERVVALAPVCDLEEAARLGLGDDATQAFLGGVDAAEADPMLLFSQRPPAEVVIVHGVEDDDVPVSLSRGFTAAHPWVELREVPVGHMEVIEPASLAWPVVLDALGSTMPSIEETRPS
jgi:acetyl esterase/lipase